MKYYTAVKRLIYLYYKSIYITNLRYILLKVAESYIQNAVSLRIKNMQDNTILFVAVYLYCKGIFKIHGNDKHQIKGS